MGTIFNVFRINQSQSVSILGFWHRFFYTTEKLLAKLTMNQLLI